ncbi:hypothetical protein K493DRAFT_55603 [Basidiobolus meristosporus CBS 931.73]|uniref:PWWP domain-containing protein n=1 Tax=Basidiobolus meristosporus CBS 931.73 TaxID=1314790 RepID=A0A1Y1XYQ9_9FUNG|nr:hypothetical protein K493DRAFT_55603 [Basidiobolus meristosporus CBS 931.73]|eukprot:ORX90881.1 hypothetical protein K493DRAFT_55603 [Basidiobolus meristosporus CBS 931.73]
MYVSFNLEADVSTKPTTNAKPDKQRATTRFKGREVVFVDPLDESAEYWWPAMVVPPSEIDRSMVSRKLECDECLVRYFEDNKFSICKISELTLFQPGEDPFNEFTDHRSFLRDPGVVIALKYLQTGELGKKFMWKLWGKDKAIPPVAPHPSTPPSDQEKAGLPNGDSDAQTPPKKSPQEQTRSSGRKRKKTGESDDSGNHHGRGQGTASGSGKQKNPISPPSPAERKKSTSSATSETDSGNKHEIEPVEQHESMTLKEISRRMKVLRKEYRKIRRGVGRIAKELVVHKAGDGRITRSMMRRKR